MVAIDCASPLPETSVRIGHPQVPECADRFGTGIEAFEQLCEANLRQALCSLCCW
jgi:hypothetical protein